MYSANTAQQKRTVTMGATAPIPPQQRKYVMQKIAWGFLAVAILLYVIVRIRAKARRGRRLRFRLRSQREQAAFEPLKTFYDPRLFRQSNRERKD